MSSRSWLFTSDPNLHDSKVKTAWSSDIPTLFSLNAAVGPDNTGTFEDSQVRTREDESSHTVLGEK